MVTFLGLDLSTQQLKAVVLSYPSISIVHESAVHFDRDLPHYSTTNGSILGPAHGQSRSPTLMWIEAVDLIIEKMKKAGVDFAQIKAIGGAGQQHGSVYWSQFPDIDAQKSLKDNLSAAFTVALSPIWQDSSTTAECQALEVAVGGPQSMADISGSRAYERFTASQIKKLYDTQPDVYSSSTRISLVSSFLPSLFLGHVAPIEISDASGMNLMDVLSCKWDDRLLDACAPNLRDKLGPEPVPGGTNLGTVSDYWVQRHGFSADCIITPFTGDNPSTVVALSSFPGDALLSLGTSTTFLLSIPPSSNPPKRFTTSHLLAHPTNAPSGQIAMLCYKNGALARESIRDQYAEKDWNKFNQLVESVPVGCNGFLGMYYPLTEIIPLGAHGNYFFNTSTGEQVEQKDIPENLHPRLILESQFLSIKSRIEAILPSSTSPSHGLHRLVLTGGSSANPVIQQIAADIFGIEVFVADEGGTKEAGALGGAGLAMWGWWITQVQVPKPDAADDGLSFEAMLRSVKQGSPVHDLIPLKLVASPSASNTVAYEEMVPVYGRSEGQLVGRE